MAFVHEHMFFSDEKLTVHEWINKPKTRIAIPWSNEKTDLRKSQSLGPENAAVWKSVWLCPITKP